ncbi:MAG: selenium-dependent xanthine dehydrogenase [Desulfosarcinaceae bacterium]|nr:selenium-dependent xanthine dehydrogenase [Desulfosarcinaceae bacterium]
MLEFSLNGSSVVFTGDPGRSLLSYLRTEAGIFSAKDGCSGQATCGACLVEVAGRPVLACATPMEKVAGRDVVTIEGFPEGVRRTLGRAFVAAGAVQCGFCTPGILTRAKLLLDSQPNPSRSEVAKSLKSHLCRCTGYVKIVDAILLAAAALRNGDEIAWETGTGVGVSTPKVDAYEKAVGRSAFIDDMQIAGMLHGALKFSDHPRARLLGIDAAAAEQMPGVIRVFGAADIPGARYQGIKVKDWPMFVAIGEETRCIGDVICGVVAESDALARAAVDAIRVTYDILEPLTDVAAAADSPVKVHPDGNLLKETVIRRGEPVTSLFAAAAHVVAGEFETPFVEHAFLETETSIAVPADVDGGGLTVYSQNQGIFADRRQIADLLAIPERLIDVVQVAAGGGFGGKEDLTVQHHAALYSHCLQRPVKVHLRRPESLRMHPKRHHMRLHYRLACDAQGRLTALEARILGDTGAYASVGGEVVARTGTHAAGAYHLPSVDVVARAYYTNNPPAGAFRGFGVNQATFAMERMVEALCEAGGFDPWDFRYANALDKGRMTTTGHVLGDGVGLRQCLAAVKPAYDRTACTGLACAIKNCGIGNGVEEISDTRLKVAAADRILLYHGWTEMGQGMHTVACQILCEVLGLDAAVTVDIRCHTAAEAVGGMTTASRGTVLLGNSVIAAAEGLKADLANASLSDLVGREYSARYRVDWTTAPDAPGGVVSHFSYGYAVHMAALDSDGAIDTIYAAHDAGRIVNPLLFEGQVEGGVVMGLGYATRERFPLKAGRLTSEKLAALKLPRVKDVPAIVVIGIECPDTMGPFGAKGVGEIGTIPTAPAIANAYCRYDGQPRNRLPLAPVKRVPKKE